MATKRKVKRFDEGGDAGGESSGSNYSNEGRNQISGDSQAAGEARAGMGFAGTGSGLGGTGADMAQRGIGGEGPYLGERQGDFVSSAEFSKQLQNGKTVNDNYASVGLGLNNQLKDYLLSSREDNNGDVVDHLKRYNNPYAAQNEFNYQSGRLKKSLGQAKGGSVKKMASGGKVSSASKRADGIAQRGKTKGRMC
jgi:hypothetical protein